MKRQQKSFLKNNKMNVGQTYFISFSFLFINLSYNRKPTSCRMKHAEHCSKIPSNLCGFQVTDFALFFRNIIQVAHFKAI